MKHESTTYINLLSVVSAADTDIALSSDVTNPISLYLCFCSRNPMPESKPEPEGACEANTHPGQTTELICMLPSPSNCRTTRSKIRETFLMAQHSIAPRAVTCTCIRRRHVSPVTYSYHNMVFTDMLSRQCSIAFSLLNRYNYNNISITIILS